MATLKRVECDGDGFPGKDYLRLFFGGVIVGYPPVLFSVINCPLGFLLPSRTCLYFLIFGKVIIEGRYSLHDFFGRYIMEFEKTPEIKSINYMKKVKLRVERGKSG